MWAPTRRTAPVPPLPVAVNPAAEKHALADPEAVGGQGGAGVVAQLCPGAVELAADVGADQADRALLSVADGPFRLLLNPRSNADKRLAGKELDPAVSPGDADGDPGEGVAHDVQDAVWRCAPCATTARRSGGRARQYGT